MGIYSPTILALHVLSQLAGRWLDPASLIGEEGGAGWPLSQPFDWSPFVDGDFRERCRAAGVRGSLLERWGGLVARAAEQHVAWHVRQGADLVCWGIAATRRR